LLDFAKATLPESGGRTKNFFVALGEPSSARFLAQRIHDYLGSNAIVPVQSESFEITKDNIKRLNS
jgi:hypothetical protein